MWGKLGLVLMGVAMLSKSLTQLSIDGQSCVPSLLFGLRPKYGRRNEGNGNLHQKDLCLHCCVHTVNSFVHTRTAEKGAVTPQETEPDMPVGVQESLAEAWDHSGLLWDQGH